MLFQVPLYGNAFCCYHHPHSHHHHRYLHHYFHHYHQHVITTTTIIITVIFFVIIIIAVIETFPLFIPGKKRGISRRPLQGKAKRGKRVVESCCIHPSLLPSLPPSLPPILSFIMIANIFYLPLNSTEDFHNQASCVPISAPILGTQQLRIFSRYSNSKSKQRYSVALCRLGRNESCITTCAHSFGWNQGRCLTLLWLWVGCMHKLTCIKFQ